MICKFKNVDYTHRDSKIGNFAKPSASDFLPLKQSPKSLQGEGDMADAEGRKDGDAGAGKKPILESRCVYIHFDTIDSTNTWAKTNAHTLDPEKLSCITALEQTAGRGRFSRKWLSPHGQNIYATLFFVIPKGSPYLPNLGQILAYSCASVLKEKGFEVEIKWPNDLLIDEKKVAGILSETVSMNDSCGIALGIGINVNMGEELLKKIDQPATSLAQLSMKTWKLEQILEPLIQQFLEDFEVLHKKGFAPFQSNFQKLLAYKGQEITCNDGVKTVQGICQGITKDGKLELLPYLEPLFVLSSGEVEIVIP